MLYALRWRIADAYHRRDRCCIRHRVPAVIVPSSLCPFYVSWIVLPFIVVRRCDGAPLGTLQTLQTLSSIKVILEVSDLSTSARGADSPWIPGLKIEEVHRSRQSAKTERGKSLKLESRKLVSSLRQKHLSPGDDRPILLVTQNDQFLLCLRGIRRMSGNGYTV